MRYFLFNVGSVVHCITLKEGEDVADFIESIWNNIFSRGFFLGAME